MTKIVRETHPGDSTAASELFTRANEAYDQGDYLLAIELLDDAISSGLSSVVALNNKGAALDALGRREAAEECYRTAISRSSSYELAWHNLGNCLFSQERFRQSARAYARARRLNRDRVENVTGLAESLVEIGRMRSARRVVRKLSAAAEEDRSLLLIQADLYIRAGDGESAVERCESYTHANPDDAVGHASLGGIWHEQGEYSKAIASFIRALKLSSDDPQIWNNFGYTCFCDGQVDRALAAFDRAVEIDPGYKHAWYNKGYSLHGVDRLDEAVRCYEKALAIDPYDPILLNNLGNALYNLGRYADSLPSFVEAIDVDSDYEIAWNNIGNALEKMGLYDDAIPFHDRSLEIRPDFDYALYAKGVCKTAVGDPEEGFGLLVESLDLNPSYDEAWKARSQAARALGRMDDALSAIEMALELNPSQCDGWVERGDMLADMGDGLGANASYLRALRCAEELFSAMPLDGDPWRMRSWALFRLGRYDEALESAAKAVASRHPDTDALPLAFDICRVADIPELPKEVVEAVEGQGNVDWVLPYAAFLARKGDWGQVSSILSKHPVESLGQNGRALMARAIALTDGRDEALAFVQGCPPAEHDCIIAEIEYCLGNWGASIERFRLCIDRTPGDYAAVLGLAVALLRAERHREALDAAAVAAGIDVSDWEPHDIMAEAFESLGDEKRASAARALRDELEARCRGGPSAESEGEADG